MDVKFLRSNPLYAVNRQTPRVTPKVYVQHGPLTAWVDENTNTWQKPRRRTSSVARRSGARKTPLPVDSKWRQKSPRVTMGVRSTRSAELRRMSSLRKLGHESGHESEETVSDPDECWPRPPMTVQRDRQYMSRYRAAFRAEQAWVCWPSYGATCCQIRMSTMIVRGGTRQAWLTKKCYWDALGETSNISIWTLS